MPKGSRIKTTWVKKKVIKKRPIKKVVAMREAERQKLARKRRGVPLRNSDKAVPGKVKLVMAKPRDFDHPLEEILFPEEKDGLTPHERLVKFQEECRHSYSKVLAEVVDNGRKKTLIECGQCWAARWQ